MVPKDPNDTKGGFYYGTACVPGGEGTKRFGELKKSIGTVSQKVLTAQLRDMEAKGLLTRTVYAEVPPRVEYTLTETGCSLKPILDSMVVWGTDYQRRNGGAACAQ